MIVNAGRGVPQFRVNSTLQTFYAATDRDNTITVAVSNIEVVKNAFLAAEADETNDGGIRVKANKDLQRPAILKFIQLADDDALAQTNHEAYILTNDLAA